RRRHTRWPRDWSSDVCSSDLDFHLDVFGPHIAFQKGHDFGDDVIQDDRGGGQLFASEAAVGEQVVQQGVHVFGGAADALGKIEEIGRASCRERVERGVGGG